MPAWVEHRGCHWLQWKVYANPCTCPPCMPATLQHACSRAAQFLMRGSAGSHHVLLCRAARSHGLNPKGQHERLPNLSSNPSQNFKKPAVTPWPNAIAKPSLHSTQGSFSSSFLAFFTFFCFLLRINVWASSRICWETYLHFQVRKWESSLCDSSSPSSLFTFLRFVFSLRAAFSSSVRGGFQDLTFKIGLRLLAISIVGSCAQCQSESRPGSGCPVVHYGVVLCDLDVLLHQFVFVLPAHGSTWPLAWMSSYTTGSWLHHACLYVTVDTVGWLGGGHCSGSCLHVDQLFVQLPQLCQRFSHSCRKPQQPLFQLK